MKRTFTSKFLFIILFLAGGIYNAQVTPVCLSVKKSGVPNTPFENTLADFNGDGFLDVATSIFGSNQMSVMLGNASGTFTTAAGSPYPVGVQPWGICNGDFNGDGKLDLAVANYNSASMNIFIGNGTGGFTAGTSVAGMFADVISGDFNNDAKTDLLAVSSSMGNFSLFLGSGTGTFTLAAGSPYPAGNIALYAEKADFNTDGNQDVAIINFGGSSCSVYLGNGTGGFTQAVGSPFATLSSPRQLGISDFNNDAIPDIAFATQGTSKMQVFLGNGVGTFTQAAGSPYSTPTNGYALTTSDYNGDGNNDIAVGNDQASGTNLYIFLGNGTGTFTPAPSFPVSVAGGYYWDFKTADVNNDSKPDIIATDRGGVPEVTVFLNGVFLANSTATACAGASLVLNPGVADTYSWSTGATTQTIAITPTATTIYTVMGTTTLTSCNNTATITVYANPSPTVTINSSTTTICAGSSVNLSANGADTYSWSTTASTQSIVVSPSANAIYSVNGTNTLTGCSNSATVGISVNPSPTVTAVSSSSLICIGQSATLTASGGLTYVWNTSATTAVIAVSPSVTTTYTVTGFNAGGCSNSSTIIQNVSLCIGLTELQAANMQLVVFPNPNNGEFTLRADADIDLNIVNELGQTVISVVLTGSNNREIVISDLPNGIYFVVGQNNSQIIKQKIVVAK